jgi:serpin B
MRVLALLFFVLIFSAALSACSSAESDGGAPAEPAPAQPEAAAPSGSGPAPAEAAPAEPAPAGPAPAEPAPPAGAEPPAEGEAASGAARAAQAFNETALALYQKTAAPGENFFFSPYSVSGALAMAYAGAAGDTAAEFEAALKYPFKGEEFLAAQKALSGALAGAGGAEPEFVAANSLWPALGLDISDSFLKLMNAYFGPLVFPVDYQNKEPEARGQINDWVARTTRDKITDFLSGPLSPQTKLILVNAVYFKGSWSRAFDPKDTQEKDFNAPKGAVKAPFMSRRGGFNYLEEDSLQALELLYEGNSASMLVLLPKEGADIGDLEKRLAPDALKGWLGSLKSREVQVFLPKFKITWGTTSIKPQLEALGLKLVFSAGADLTGISPDKPLLLDDVVHKACVEVNEEGTEAAAATGAMMRATSISVEPPPVFQADRPFIFLIIDKATGAITFMGKVTDPS